MEIIKNIFKVVSNILYVFIFMYAIIALPLVLGYKPVVVLSGSMEPAYSVGSIIYYKPVKEASFIKEGDVITYELEQGVLVTHRVVTVDGKYFVTKGDANNIEDPRPIAFDQVRGVVSKYFLPYVGYCVQYFNNHIFIVWMVILILVIDFILSNIDFDKPQDNEDIVKKSSGRQLKEAK